MRHLFTLTFCFVFVNKTFFMSPMLWFSIIFPVAERCVFLAVGFSTPTLVYKILRPDHNGFSSALYCSDLCVPNWTRAFVFSTGDVFKMSTTLPVRFTFSISTVSLPFLHIHVHITFPRQPLLQQVHTRSSSITTHTHTFKHTSLP